MQHSRPNIFFRFRSWCGAPAPFLSSLWLAEPWLAQGTILVALSTPSMSPITFRKKKKHVRKSVQTETINEQRNNCFRRDPRGHMHQASQSTGWTWMTVTEIGRRTAIFPRGLQVVLSCIVSTSVTVLVLRVNLEEKQKWRLYMTHYLQSQRGNSSHNSGLAYLCTVIWNTT